MKTTWKNIGRNQHKEWEKQREFASQLDFSFFPTLGFPTRIRIQIEFARPHVSNTYPDNLLPRTPLGILETEHASR